MPTYISKPGIVWADSPIPTQYIAPQQGVTNGISVGVDGRIQNVVFRNGSLWCVQTVYLPTNNPTRALLQWWELDPRNKAVLQHGRLDSGHAGVMYAFPSIAVNRFNDVLIGYSNFATNAYASASYSFRAFDDDMNTLRTGRLLKSGEAAYETDRRWGDYSATVVDPINDADFWTVQEYANSGQNAQGLTWWGQIKVDLPTNDQFSAAAVISGASGSLINTSKRATKETSEPNHAGQAGGASIWFNWTAPYNGQVAIDTIGSTYALGGSLDTVLGVYTGSSVSSLTTITNDDDSAGNLASRVVFNAVSNTTYRIAVDGVGGDSGTVVLNWLQSHAPVILVQPESTNVVANANEQATFDVLATGIPSPLSYQWQLTNSGAGWTNIANATNTSYTISNVQSNNAGSYRVAITNSSGAVTSVVATIFVHADSAARLSQLNFSTNQFRFHIYGLTNRAYVVETSTNLNSPTNWYRIYTNYVSFWYTNLSASNDPLRFYRAITNAAGP